MADNTEKLRVKSAADRTVLKIGYSKGHRGRVQNVAWEWPKLVERLSSPVQDNLTVKEFDKLSKIEQVKRKNQGYITTTQFVDGKRKITNLSKKHYILSLDIDRPKVEQFENIIDPIGGPLSEFEYFAHTTRSHTPESPRVRVIIPLFKPLTPDEFSAAGRILAHKIDATMELIDPVSYRPAQVSYLPSVSKGQPFITYHNRGRLLDGESDLLAAFEGDWTDHRQLPKSARDKVRPAVGKAQHPSEKRGIVGAYCRARDVFEQMQIMAERGLYEPAEEGATPTRWSYLLGTSRAGVVLYPEDWKIHSHQSTDPLGGKNVTTFDAERLTRFGELDPSEDEHGDLPPQEMPSYKALVNAIQSEDEYEDVREAYAQMNYDQEAMEDDAEFQSDLEEGEEVTSAPGAIAVEAEAVVKEKPAAVAKKPEVTSKAEADLLKLLDMTETGAVRKTLYNVSLILQHDKRFKGVFRFNELTERVVVTRPVSSKRMNLRTPSIKARESGDPMTDDVRTTVRRIFSAPNRANGKGESVAGWGMQVGDDDMAKAIEEVARANGFHPVKRFLQSVKWDGIPRVRRMLHEYWHVDDTKYHADVAEKMMVAAVARVFEPGHKFDYMVILEGDQGCGKSTSIVILAVRHDWFAEFTADLDKPKDVVENVIGKWIIEWPELSSMTRAESEQVKALLSSAIRTARLSYRRDQEDFRFQGVFIGTTNNEEYLRDTTGNRRYWPVRIPKGKMVDNDALRLDVEQIWAEAYQLYLWYRREYPAKLHPSLPLFLTGSSKTTAEISQQQRMVKGIEDLWTGRIVEWLETPVPAALVNGGPIDDEDELPSTKLLPRMKTCVWDVAEDCLGLDHRRLAKADRDTIGRILNSLPNWTPAHKVVRFGKRGVQRAWIRDEL